MKTKMTMKRMMMMMMTMMMKMRSQKKRMKMGKSWPVIETSTGSKSNLFDHTKVPHVLGSLYL